MTMHIGTQKLEHIAKCQVCKARLALLIKYAIPNKAVALAKPSKENCLLLNPICTEAIGLL